MANLLKPIQEFVDEARKCPWPVQLLIGLAAFSYLSQGVFLSLFSNGFDFDLVHEAAAQVSAGNGSRIYDKFFGFQPGGSTIFYMYPAPVAMFYLPFGILPKPAAFALYQVLCHAALWATVILLWNRGIRNGFDEKWRVFVLVLLFFPLNYGFQIGQSESLVLICLVLSFFLHDRGNLTSAALFLSVAIYLKAFVGLLLLYYFLSGRYRYLGRCLLWLAIIGGLSLLAVPWEIQMEYWSRVGGSLGIESFFDNQSVSGFVHRSLTKSPYTRGLVDQPALARGVQLAISAAIIAVYVVTVRKLRRSDPTGTRGLALTFVTMLLIAPHVDTHHHALLLVPFVFLTGFMAAHPGLVLFYAFFGVFHPLVSFRFLEPARVTLIAGGLGHFVLSAPFFVLLALWFYLVKKLPRMDDSGPQEDALANELVWERNKERLI